MKEFDFAAFAREVHENAVEKGWWEEERTQEELVALIISEISEALEEYRKGMPMVYRLCTEPDHRGKICGRETECSMRKVGCSPDECCKRDAKPEGIAVELIDAVLRILDICGKVTPESGYTDGFYRTLRRDLEFFKMESVLPAFEFELIKNLMVACEVGILRPNGAEMLFDIVAMPIMEWVRNHGEDPIRILAEKHAYNKGRAYRHGGKVL